MVDGYFLLRLSIALLISIYMAYNGYAKKSLNFSGCIAATIVGFVSLAASYRFGVILILFYYSSSKLTKYGSTIKSKIEENHVGEGNRNATQVFANSILATVVAVCFLLFCGEDRDVDFSSAPGTIDSDSIIFFYGLTLSKRRLASLLWSAYIAHYATSTGDTWASELGILSKQKPRLVTSLFLQEVPPGTNGGMSFLGTMASILGGGFIGVIFWGMCWFKFSQFPMVIVGVLCGLIGSFVDSLLGATIQASYYCNEMKKIVKLPKDRNKRSSVSLLSGFDFVSNEAVNFISIFITMVLSLWLAPYIFCLVNQDQC